MTDTPGKWPSRNLIRALRDAALDNPDAPRQQDRRAITFHLNNTKKHR